MCVCVCVHDGGGGDDEDDDVVVRSPPSLGEWTRNTMFASRIDFVYWWSQLKNIFLKMKIAIVLFMVIFLKLTVEYF